MCHYLYLVLPHSLIFSFSYFTFNVFFVVLYVCVDFDFSFVFNFIGINRIHSYNIFCLWFSFLQSSQIPWLWLSLLIQSWVDIAERYNNLKSDGGSRSFSAPNSLAVSCFPLPRCQGQGAGILRDNCRTGSGNNNETMSLQGCVKLQSCSVIHNTQLVWRLNSFSKSGIK